jgi:serine/threonine protein kinase/Flp pilus assembly protein TadD
MPAPPQPQRTEDPVAPGQLLADRFRVVRRIAQGGMGVVYEAYDEKLDRRIALKCARLGHDRRLCPEVRLATEVSHPNICKIYEIHTTESPEGPLEFFTMELLEGPTLSRRIEEGPLPPKEAEAIAIGLCAGLAEAHRRDIIHGDLKSANVILTKNADGTSRAVITDFGLARAASTSSATGGTPGYMAPELYTGAPITVASDIYALGVILHELISGFRPHERAAMLASTVTRLPSDPPVDRKQQFADLSQAAVPPLGSRWDKILKTCLQADPRQRYATVDQVLQALGPSALRRRVLISAGALALAAMAALATYRTSTAPAQSVRLDVAAVEAAPALATEATQLRRDALREIGRLKNSAQTAFSVRSTGWASQPTHRFSASLTPKGDKLALHAVLLDLRSGAPVIEWSADYAPAQLRYAPVALAGVVSRGLHLPALTTYATVNPAAAASYQEGIALFQDDRKLDQAQAALESAVRLDPDSALPLAALAEVQRRRFFLTKVESWKDKAIASFEQAELRNPDCAEVHRIAGLVEYDRNRQEEAIARMRRATEFQPAHPNAFRRLGEFYRQGGQLPEALQAYSEAQRLAPRDVRIYQDLATFYTQQSNLAEAAKALERALELAPDLPLFRRRLASIYKDQGRFTEAETELRALLKKENAADALVQLGQVLLYQKREKEAVPLLAQATDLDSAKRFAWLYLGLAYQRTGRAAEARSAFQRGLSVAQGEVMRQLRNGYDRAVLAYFCAQTGQSERAGIEAAQALQLAPSNSDTLWYTALTYERAGNRAAALKALENAPQALLEDLRRWPESSALTSDERFSHLLSPDAARR